MGSVRVRKDTGALFFDFIYRDTRCRELTTLKDTPENRRAMEKVNKKIDAEILLGQFNYADYFPSSSMLKKFRTADIGCIRRQYASTSFCITCADGSK